LHTPPMAIVRAGKIAVLQFLRDLAKGQSPSHLIKVVLLGDQRAGKSSLADSLMLGHPATRADNDRTVGIEVRRWRLGKNSPLVANIFDAAGQRVYRATHGFFMSAGALFLHVVRSDMAEEAAVAALLEWVEVVQQEAPGAVMGVVFTHSDWFTDGVCCGTGLQQGFLRMTGSAGGDNTTWIVMQTLLTRRGHRQSWLKDVEIVDLGSLNDRDERKRKENEAEKAHLRIETGNVQGKVALIDLSTSWYWIISSDEGADSIQTSILDVQSRGGVGVVFVIHDVVYKDEKSLNDLPILASLCTTASIQIMLIPKKDVAALAFLGGKLTAFRGVCMFCVFCVCACACSCACACV